MMSANEMPALQLPILFTHLNGDSKVNCGGAVSVLVKWDAAVNNKLTFDRADWDEANLFILESEEEHQYFRALLLEEMINRKSTLEKQQLIETVSVYFIRLMDTMFKYSNIKEVANQFKIVSEKVCQHFQQTFQFIEEFFGNYINRERKAPCAYIEMNKAEIIKKLKRAKTEFISQTENQSPLIDILVAVITEKLSAYSGISINSITYMRQLTEEIHNQNKPILEQNLRDILYSLNFNEESFVMAEYERFAVCSPDTLSKNERIRVLKQEQKRINQVAVRLNCYWNASMPSIKEQINGWLIEEIHFIESGTCAIVNQNELSENFDKIQTSLSVAKLAVILRLLVIDKIIINRQVAPALRTVTKVFTTLQKDEISFGSLETKYHAPDKATVVSVKDMLFKWINLLGKL